MAWRDNVVRDRCDLLEFRGSLVALGHVHIHFIAIKRYYPCFHKGLDYILNCSMVNHTTTDPHLVVAQHP